MIIKKNCHLEEFAAEDDLSVNVNEGETLDKYLDLAGELKKFRNMKVTVITIVIGPFGTVPENL